MPKHRFFLATLLLTACSATKPDELPAGGSGAEARVAPSSWTALVTRWPNHLPADSLQLAVGPGGVAMADDRAHGARIRITSRSDQPSRLAAIDDENAWIEWRIEGAAAARGGVDANAVAFPDALPDTDLFLTAARGGLEDVRVLRGPQAPATVTYAISYGPAIARIRVRGDRIEALDAKGVVRFVTTPLLAVDATGRSLSVRIAQAADDRVSVSVTTEGAAYPVLVDPVWSTSAPIAALARTGHLVASFTGYLDDTLDYGWAIFGGATTSGPTTDFNGCDFLTTVAKLGVARTEATATGAKLRVRAVDGPTPVSDQRIVIAGGFDGSSDLVDTEVLTPKAGATTYTNVNVTFGPPLHHKRSRHAAVRLTDGSELVIGGYDRSAVGTAQFLSSVERSNPSVTTWTDVGALTYGRASHTATLLPSGKVLVVGGLRASLHLSQAELFDAASNSWSPTTSSLTTHLSHQSLLLGDKRVLVAGGVDDTGKAVATVEAYDESTATWKTLSKMNKSRSDFTLAMLHGGRVLAAGGVDETGSALSSAELYDPAADKWTLLDPMPGARVGARMCGGYHYMLIGGSDGTAPSGVPIYLSSMLGDPCSSAAVCASGTCVDGVCCDSACSGQCESCAVGTSKGTCSIVSGAPAAGHPSCGDGSTCGARCDGVHRDACTLPTATMPCGANACSAGTETKVGTCDGLGKCVATSSSCGAYACAGTSCGTTCASPTDCAPGYVCRTADGKCVASCESTPETCSPYQCVAGFCKASCASDGDCAPGNVCRTGDGKCVASCESAAGACEPYRCVAGFCKTSCSTDGECASGYVCSASDSKCIRASVCADEHTLKSPDGKLTDCSPYVCVATGCPTECASTANCLAGFVCDNKVCVAASTADSSSSGGCSLGSSARSSAGSWLLLAGLTALARQRRSTRRN